MRTTDETQLCLSEAAVLDVQPPPLSLSLQKSLNQFLNLRSEQLMVCLNVKEAPFMHLQESMHVYHAVSRASVIIHDCESKHESYQLKLKPIKTLATDGEKLQRNQIMRNSFICIYA